MNESTLAYRATPNRRSRYILLVALMALMLSLAYAASTRAGLHRGVLATCFGSVPTTSSNTGTPGNDVMVGTPGPDTMKGKGGNDKICGGDGDDDIRGGGGDDQLDGEGDNDSLTGNGGGDLMLGGAGTQDRVNYAGRPGNAQLTINLNSINGANDGASGEGDDIRDDVERAVGDDSADAITGNASNNVLRGNKGDDIMNGGGGEDKLYGVFGFDNLTGGGDGLPDLLDCDKGNKASGGGVAFPGPEDTVVNCSGGGGET